MTKNQFVYCRVSFRQVFLGLIMAPFLVFLAFGGGHRATVVITKDPCYQGKSLYASGDVLKAIESLSKCVVNEPRNREAFVLLANSALEVGHFNEAVEAFANAQSLKEGDTTFLRSYLAALDNAGKIHESVGIWSALSAKKPEDLKTAEQFLRAVETAGSEKHPKEYLVALQAIGKFPDADHVPLEKLAIAYLGLGAPDKAEAVYLRLLQKRPEASEYWTGLGEAQSKTKPEAAAEAYRKAALFSDQVGQRQVYQSEGQRLSKAGKQEKEISPTLASAKPNEALLALEAQYNKTKNDSLLEDLIRLKRENSDEPGSMIYLEKLAEKRPTVEKYQVDLATYFQRTGDKAKTSDHYSKVLNLNPNHPDANLYLGMEYAVKGEANKSVPLLEKASGLFPKRADVWKALAKGDVALGKKDSAWKAYQTAFSLSPKDMELAKGKLALCLDMGKQNEAVQAYLDVLKISPQDKQGALGFAMLLFKTKNYVDAEKNFRIVGSDSKDTEVLAAFGKTLLETKKFDEAAALLQKAIDLGYKDEALRYDLASIRMEKGDLDWAEGLVKDIAKKSPIDPEPIYWQGRIALKRQQVGVAEDLFKRANRLKPSDGRYAEACAHLLRDKEEYKSAAAILSLAENDLATTGKLLFADCLAYSGEGAKALENYASLYQHSATSLLLARRMEVLNTLGKPDKAVELAKGSPYLEATEVQWALAKAHLTLANAHIFPADVDLAVDRMKKVVRHDNKNPDFHYFLGLAFKAQNRPGKALDEFIEANAIRPEFPWALYQSGLCQVQLGKDRDAENSFKELSHHVDSTWKARGLYGKALVFQAQNKLEAVEHYLGISAAVVPLPEVLAFQSRLRLKQGKVSEAEDLAKKVLAIDPLNEEGMVALSEALSASKRQTEAMTLIQTGLLAKPLSCELLVQSTKLTMALGKADSALVISNKAMRLCPHEPMGFYYAGLATQASNPKEAKDYFKSFRKLGGDKKMVPE